MRRYRGFSGISVLNGMLPASRANGAFTLDSSRRLKRHSNFPHIRRWTTGGGGRTTASDNGRDEHRSLSGVGCGVNTGGGQEMGRFEVMGIDSATLGEANAAEDVFFQLGMMYSTGSTVSADYVSAHKWFNLAAMRGNKDATRLRREIAEQMSENEIAAAQRAARDWLKH